MKSLFQVIMLLMGMSLVGGSTLIDKKANVAKLDKIEQAYLQELHVLKDGLDSANQARDDQFAHFKDHVFKQYLALLDENETLERERNHFKRMYFDKAKSEPSPRDTIISTGYGTLDFSNGVYHIPITNKDSINHPIQKELIQPIHIGKYSIHEE